MRAKQPDTLKELREQLPKLRQAHEFAEKKLTRAEKFCVWVNGKIGTMFFFCTVLSITAFWVIWNLFAPEPWKFDSSFGLFGWFEGGLSLILLPLLMIGQNVQRRNADARADFSYLAAQKSSAENELMINHLEHILTLVEDIRRRDSNYNGPPL